MNPNGDDNMNVGQMGEQAETRHEMWSETRCRDMGRAVQCGDFGRERKATSRDARDGCG